MYMNLQQVMYMHMYYSTDPDMVISFIKVLALYNYNIEHEVLPIPASLDYLIVKPSMLFIITMVKVNSTVNGYILTILTFLTHRGLPSPWSQGASPWSRPATSLQINS